MADPARRREGAPSGRQPFRRRRRSLLDGGVLALSILLGGSPDAPGTARAADLGPPIPGVDARAVAERAEANLRAERTYLEARMIVRSPRLPAPREVAFRSWDDKGGKRSFIRIDQPAKDRGTGFLKLHPNLWMWIPRVERTMRIPPSMMLQSWMGSDFTHDDLVRESSEIEDYHHEVIGSDGSLGHAEGRLAHVVEYLPKEGAAVVWGRIVAWIDTEHFAPLQQEFYDEAGERLRVLRFEDLRPVSGRQVPHRWSLEPLDKPGHATRIEIEEIRFDPRIDGSVFTKRHLRRSDGAR